MPHPGFARMRNTLHCLPAGLGIQNIGVPSRQQRKICDCNEKADTFYLNENIMTVLLHVIPHNCSEMHRNVAVTGHNGHKPKRPQPKRPQTEKATNRNGHKPEWPQTETATNRNGHKPKRPQTGTATNRNGHRPERPQIETATDLTGHKPKRPQTGTVTNRKGHISCHPPHQLSPE